jgi:hypothetical protein
MVWSKNRMKDLPVSNVTQREGQSGHDGHEGPGPLPAPEKKQERQEKNGEGECWNNPRWCSGSLAEKEEKSRDDKPKRGIFYQRLLLRRSGIVGAHP